MSLEILFAFAPYDIAVKMVRPKYYTPNEVAVHNTLDDLWVSFLGKVYDLTPLCEKYKGETFSCGFLGQYISGVYISAPVLTV